MKNENTCNICGNVIDNISYIGREMMFGFRDEFKYFKCSKCGCLQLSYTPDDLDKYYPSNYYSFNNVQSDKLKDRIVKYLSVHSIKKRFGLFDCIGWFAMKYNNYYSEIHPWLNPKYCDFNSKILDIGCGSGGLLFKLHDYGFTNLAGVDPFIQGNIDLPGGGVILKNEIYNISGQYDYIMMHHVLEHMPNPHDVFLKLKQLLSDNGTLLIRIPVVNGYAWRKYGMNWFQIDTPRHLFIYTVNSISYLAEKYGFIVETVAYDSTDSQIAYSEKYVRNISLCEESVEFTKLQRDCFKRKVMELNFLMDGDQACFYLKKK